MTSSDYTIRRAGFDEIPRLSEFRKTNFPYEPRTRSCEPDYYYWKLKNNPFLPGEIWLAESDGAIVGSASITPKPMMVNGEQLLGAESGDTFTHPDFQRRGIFARLLTAAIESSYERGIRFVYGFPNTQSLPAAVKRTPYHVASLGLYSTVRVLDAKALLPERLARLPLFSETVNAGIKAISLSARIRRDEGVTVIDAFPEDFDSLWDRTAADYDIAVVKKRDYLTWRYFENPRPYLVLLARDRSGNVTGYLVAARMTAERAAVIRVADYLTVRDDGATFKKLTAHLAAIAKSEGAAAVSAVAVKGGYYHRLLKQQRFLTRNEVFLLCTEKMVTGEAAKNYRWHLLLGDSDNI